MNKLFTTLIGFAHQTGDFLVNRSGCRLRMILLTADFTTQINLLFVIPKGLETKDVAHAVCAHHATGQMRSHLDILRRASRTFARVAHLSNTSCRHHHEHILHLVFGVIEHIAFGQGHRRAQCTATGDNRHLVKGFGVIQEHLRQRMTAFVPRRDAAILVGHGVRTPFAAPEHLITRLFHIHMRHGLTIRAHRQEGGFIQEVCQISTRETGRAACDAFQIHILAQLHLVGMHLQDCQAAFGGRQIHHNLAVKTTRTRQRRVQHIHAVGRRHHNHAAIAFKAIHLDQHGIQRLLTFVMATANARKTGSANRVNFVNKEDARRILLGLGKHITHAACTDAHKHFHEVRTANGEEGHICFARDRLRQQGLTRSRRPHQEHTLRHLTANLFEPLRRLQEVHNFLNLFLRLIHACHIGEANLRIFLVHHASTRLTKGKRPFALTLHATHKEDVKERKEDQNRQHGDKHRAEPIRLVLLDRANAISRQAIFQVGHIQDVQLKGFSLRLRKRTLCGGTRLPHALKRGFILPLTHQDHLCEGGITLDFARVILHHTLFDTLPEFQL